MYINNSSHITNNIRVKQKEHNTSSKSVDNSKDFVNSPNPAEYLGRSQVVFSGRGDSKQKNKQILPELKKEDLQPIKLVKNEPISKEEAIDVLKQLSFTDDDISKIDLNNDVLLEKFSGMKNYFNIYEYKDEKEELLENFKSATSEEKLKFVNEELVDTDLSYLNQENYDSLKKYIDFDIDELYGLSESINNSENKEVFLEKLPLLYFANGAIDIHDVYKIIRANSFADLSYDKANIIRKVNNVLDSDQKINPLNFGFIGDDKDLSSENISEYLKLLNDFKDNKKLDISSFSNFDENYSLNDYLNSMSKINDVLAEYPMDLSTNDENKKLNKCDIESFISRDDIKDVQSYVNSLTPESKYTGIKYMPDVNNKDFMPDIANICNIISQKDYGQVNTDNLFEFINQKSKEDGFDINGITKLIEFYKGTNNLKYNPSRMLSVNNNDYDEAMRSYSLKSEFKKNNLNFNDYLFNDIVHNGEGDIKNYNKVLQYIKNNDMNCYEIPYEFYQNSNGYNKTVLYNKIAKNSGLTDKQKFDLNKIADTVKNDEELNYAIELFYQRKFPDSDDYTLRFNWDFNGINDIMTSYQKDKETTNKVLNLKDKYGYWQFNNANDVLSVVDSLSFDKKFTEKIINMKNDKGGLKFHNGENVFKIVKASQKDKDFALELLNKKNEFRSRCSERFNADDIAGLIDCAQVDKDFIRYLIDLNIVDDYGKHYRIDDAEFAKYLTDKAQTDKKFVVDLLNMEEKRYDGTKYSRFSNSQIKAILDNPPENKEFLLEIINKKDTKYGYERNVYTSDDIANLAVAISINPELTKSLMSKKFGDNSENRNEIVYPRFTSTRDIKDIVEASTLDTEFTQTLLNKTKMNYDGKLYPQYSAEDIVQFLNLRKDYPLDKITRLMDFKTVSFFDNKEQIRFEKPYEVKMLLEAEVKNKPLYDELLNKKRVISNGTETYMYGSVDIMKIIDSYDIDSEYTRQLLNENDDNKSSIKSSGDEILTFTKCAQIDKDFTDKLRQLKYKNKNGRFVNRFDSYDIKTLINEKFKDKDYLLELAKLPNSNKSNFRIVDTHQLSIVVKASEQYGKDYVNELLALKNPENNNSELKVTEISDIVNNLSYKDFKELKTQLGDKINLLNGAGIVTASQFKNLYQINNLNELSISSKKDLLMNLISTNVNLFGISDVIKKYYPLLPTTQEEYCSTLPEIVKSIGIETKDLSAEKIENFNKTLDNLSTSLGNMNDDDFDKLEISQKYSKNEFIKDVLTKMESSNLSDAEKQKVFNYYGFELHNNPNNETGYSIVGYPVNIDSDKKLADIKNPKTKNLIEDLKSNVVNFTDNNKILANDKSIEKLLNDIVDTLPELRTGIDKKGDESMNYDLMTQSLKVIQKMSQSTEFKALNNSDKKILLLSALMQNIAKAEGFKDVTNPNESSFDTFFITKKFHLSKDEEIKLYTMIKNQNWLENINLKPSTKEKTKAMQSVAFDLQQNNNFDMEMILAKANIESLKETSITKNDLEETYNNSIAKIDDYIKELKKSQPLLPVTKMPKASELEKNISYVNSDGSTNIKGVYKDKSGLVVVKFNEVEDWSKLGLPKNSSNRGIKAKAVDMINGAQVETETETGNIKFFVHGLDYSNQLAKFDAFALPNSDALLSVSYAERPETKYRFFRPQGIMLDVPADYVYGGGNTDSGSGCGKSIDIFKNEYVFGGHRESDREYVSNLIKEATGMSDEEYVKFVDKYKNKAMTEIEPKELQDKIIKKLATINSNSRKGNRSYNEMYISNPKSVMGVFAYEMDKNKNIDNPLKFLEENNSRTAFLKEYALEHDIPFYLFGD